MKLKPGSGRLLHHVVGKRIRPVLQLLEPAQDLQWRTLLSVILRSIIICNKIFVIKITKRRCEQNVKYGYGGRIRRA